MPTGFGDLLNNDVSRIEVDARGEDEHTGSVTFLQAPPVGLEGKWSVTVTYDNGRISRAIVTATRESPDYTIFRE